MRLIYFFRNFFFAVVHSKNLYVHLIIFCGEVMFFDIKLAFVLGLKLLLLPRVCVCVVSFVCWFQKAACQRVKFQLCMQLKYDFKRVNIS